MLTYIKSGFLDITKEDIYNLENYCIKYGIKGKKWYGTEWKKYDNTMEELNELRIKIVNPLLELKEKLQRQNNVTKITEYLYRFLEQNNIREKLTNKIKELDKKNEPKVRDEYKRSFEILNNILDELVLVLGEENINFKKYSKLLKLGVSYNDLGNIPQAIDQITIGDIDRTRNRDIKVCFIVSLNDGIFRNVNIQEGFLNDKDREILKQNNAEIAKGSLEMLYDNQFNLYKVFTAPEERLYLYYLSSDSNGKALRPFMFINKIKKMFPRIEEKSTMVTKQTEITTEEAMFTEMLLNIRKLKAGDKIDELWLEIYSWFESQSKWKERLERALYGIKSTNEADVISIDNIKKLYGEKLSTSISRLEQYQKCPFSFYLKYGLKIQEPNEFKIKSIDTGTFIHDVIDEFFQNIDNINTINNQTINDVVKDIVQKKLQLNENYIFSSTPKFRVLTNRLIKVIIQSLEYIVYQIQKSDFKLLGNEIEFTHKIENTEIIGKIDRIDIGKLNGEKFVRIIDYKSSIKDINLNELSEGLQIQLITYIDAIAKKENAVPAGMFYFNIIDPIIKTKGNLSDEEIKAELRKQFKMKGLILADVNIIKMMDKSIDSGTSDIVPVVLNADGSISKRTTSTISSLEFNNLQKYANKLIKQISKEIMQGKINIMPIYNAKTKTEACKYCNYKSICRFDKSCNKYKYIANRPKDEVLKNIENNLKS